MLTTSIGFGGFREDVVGALGPFLGTGQVTSFINSLEAEIRAQAEAGARQAIPDIKIEVEQTARSTVLPYVAAALILGAFGAIAGGLALYRSRS